MSTNVSPERDAGAALPTSSTASLEQVRELLVGSQFREMERKLARVDAHLAAESEELRKELRRRLEVLEAHLQRESEALVTRFESERSAHADAITSANREARETMTTLEQRIKRMEESLARAQRELRQQILDQAKAFLDETQRTRDEIASTLERELSGDRREGDDRAWDLARRNSDDQVGH